MSLRKVLDWTFWIVLVLATVAAVAYVAVFLYAAYQWDLLWGAVLIQ